MKPLSFKNLSILGLVLTVTSAVTAAVIPSKDKAKDADKFGMNSIVPSSDGASVTCVPAAGESCIFTADSGTTGGLVPTSMGTTVE
ncbi:hypothetical protein [Chitinophaga japonensis]|uniref:Uncharacterized protein n=1 Tax=Chitinophaga japonensis TaxID=104662 RepID=A0A562SSU9_CHIJA|nr:hypothetical protein [Chitinophaga japonensis]TWI84359.1 hypothetical protein LX66_4726 [Chitinophaga japonensis]